MRICSSVAILTKNRENKNLIWHLNAFNINFINAEHAVIKYLELILWENVFI